MEFSENLSIEPKKKREQKKYKKDKEDDFRVISSGLISEGTRSLLSGLKKIYKFEENKT